MKLLPAILLNVVVALAAILVYDQLRGEDAAEPAPGLPPTVSPITIAGFEARLSALETAWRLGPDAKDADAEVLARLEKLESLAGTVSAEESPGEVESVKPEAPSGKDPSPEEIASFRKIQDAARQQERARRIGRRVDTILDALGISLTDEQRGKLVETFQAFESRRDEIWGEAKQRGMEEGASVDWPRIIENTNVLIVRELTERVSAFIPGEDAARIAEGLNPEGK